MTANFHSSLRVFTFGFLRGIAHPWLAFCHLAGEYIASLAIDAVIGKVDTVVNIARNFARTRIQ